MLWGRSMGAVAGILYLAREMQNNMIEVVGAVYDSPFYSLSKLALGLGSKTMGVP